MAASRAASTKSQAAGPPDKVDLAEDPDLATKVIGTMWQIRRFEEAVDDLFARGLMHGTMHLSIGQEAVATGACLALTRQRPDHSTHRGHGHCIAKGADLDRMMAELLGQGDRLLPRPGRFDAHRRRRYRHPRRERHRGRRHPDRRRRGAGAETAERPTNVAVSFFGDGATNEGAFHEGLNLAAVWDLPVDLHLREQRLRHVDVERAVDGGAAGQ